MSFSFTKFWEFIKKVWSFKLVIPDYNFNKDIFRLGILIILFWLMIAAVDFGWDWKNHFYFVCHDSVRCENPFYTPLVAEDLFSLNNELVYSVRPCPVSDPVICSKEFFFPGETYGSPPSFFMTHAGLFSLLIVFLMLFFNHIFFNKGYFRKRKKLFDELEDWCYNE